MSNVPAPDEVPAPSERPLERGLLQRFGRTPLLGKIVLLDLFVNVGTYVLLRQTPAELVQQVTLVSLIVVLFLNAGLVAWALEPLQLVEAAARRVSEGELAVRVGPMPRMTDRNLLRVGQTLDALLDRLDVERRRVRTLAAQLVKAGDDERARIARELHDGTAQSLSALEMLLASAQSERSPEALAERLVTMRAIAAEALAEVRTLSHTVHPRVLDDLGLSAALEWLARRSGAGTPAEIVVACDVPASLSPSIAAVLYRVSQESLSNALRHGEARNVAIDVREERGWVRLSVEDDGKGFERSRIDAARSGRAGRRPESLDG